MALVKNGLAALPGKQSFKLAVVCLRLCSFRLASDIFCNFFGNVIRRVQVWRHVVATKKTNINNWHFLKSLFIVVNIS